MNKTQQPATKESYSDLMVNPTSERNVISICLGNPDKIIEVENQELFAEHFGVHANKYIYMAMLYLYSKKAMPEPMAVYEVLTDVTAKAEIDKMGGLEYLVMLKDSKVHQDNLKMYCDKVKQSFTRRAMYDICDAAQKLMISPESEKLNPHELISTVEGKIGDLSLNISSTNEVYKMGDETEEVLRVRAENPDSVAGIETGWVEVDRATNGFLPGDLTVIVAESKAGKSALLTNWATNMSILGDIPVLYIDTEMNHREQEDRILARLSGVAANEIISGMYVMDTSNGKAVDKIKRINEAREKLGMGNYFHIQMPNFTLEKVTAIARKFHIQYGIEAMFFDYIKISSGDTGSLKNIQEYQALGFFTSGLKDIASILGIPIFTAAQSNRTNLGEVDKDASSIGGSYRILQLATKLMFLSSKSDEQIIKHGIENGNTVLSIKYQRNGESNCPPIDIMFYRHILYLKEV